MPILLIRVDERLIHGQVVVGWGGPLRAQRIVVVDDQLVDSPWEQELYHLGVPPDVETAFVSVEEARVAFPQWRNSPERVIVLVRDVASASRLAHDLLTRHEEVNLGGVHHAPGRDRYLPYLFLAAEERELLRDMQASNIAVAARDLPGSRRVPIDELLGTDVDG